MKIIHEVPDLFPNAIAGCQEYRQNTVHIFELFPIYIITTFLGQVLFYELAWEH